MFSFFSVVQKWQRRRDIVFGKHVVKWRNRPPPLVVLFCAVFGYVGMWRGCWGLIPFDGDASFLGVFVLEVNAFWVGNLFDPLPLSLSHSLGMRDAFHFIINLGFFLLLLLLFSLNLTSATIRVFNYCFPRVHLRAYLIFLALASCLTVMELWIRFWSIPSNL